MKTNHKVIFQDASDLSSIPSHSVDLVVTSPPYPMIGMWDEMFCSQDSAIESALDEGDGRSAFDLMHNTLNPVWSEIHRVLKGGRFVCINIGDATRKIGQDFQLYSNHSRILNYLLSLGFSALPDILWRKQTNAPNKFMGSGMLPAGAYVTLEHEYVLILRKGSKRVFKTWEEKRNRQESAIFWEERNKWYSDIWMDLKGAAQDLSDKMSRLRSAAFPFELPMRLINMYSVRGDVVLDPFLGTGTTCIASMVAGRNSIGFEIDSAFEDPFHSMADDLVGFANEYMEQRLRQHILFVRDRLSLQKPIKYTNSHYGFPVTTRQEQQLILYNLLEVVDVGTDAFEVSYQTSP
ncbi:MAG: site-specific DNA-methyltransferase, partial [bacterium]|nr:site-specific DNA-methyltransferase [bacterium]